MNSTYDGSSQCSSISPTFNSIYPDSNEKNILLVGSNGILNEESKTNLVPYGLWNLGYSLRLHSDFGVNVLDPNLKYSQESIRKYFSAKVFDVVGFSIIPANLESDIKLINLVQEVQPNTKIIVGGVASEMLIEYLRQVKSYIDYLVIGDGIKPILDITSHGQKNTEMQVTTSPISKKPHFIPEDLIPYGLPDGVHDFGYEKNTNFGLTISNKCKLKCFWCVSPKDGPFYDTPESAIDTLQYAFEKEEYKSLVFHDNDIANDVEFMVSVFELMKGKVLAVPKHGKATIPTMKLELLQAMSKVNFERVAYGVESFDVNVRKGLGKNYTNEKIDSILDATLNCNMIPEINLILFSPFETLQSLERTVCKMSKYIQKGAIPFIVNNLYSVLGNKSEGEKRKLNVNHRSVKVVSRRNEEQYISLPTYYKNQNIPEFILEFEKKYSEEISKNQRLTQLQKSLIKLKIIANMLGLPEEEDVFEKFLQNGNPDLYINI